MFAQFSGQTRGSALTAYCLLERGCFQMIRLSVILLLFLGFVSPLYAAEKRALLIGVNDYTKGPDDWDLRGCENDVLMTSELLATKFGFPEENIKVLLSAEATAQNITSAIEDWLISDTEPEDIVYFHFSGHGSQARDLDGDEEDGMDELICPSDMLPGNLRTVITDDQLKDLLDRIPSRNVTVVLDACHSGTGTRDISLSRPRFVDFTMGESDETRAVVVTEAKPQPSSQQPSPVKEDLPQNKLEKPPGSAGMEGGKQLRVTISGCKPEQTSADAWISEDFYAGALTYNLIENMKRAPADITYRELMERVVRDVAAMPQRQIPQVEGDMDLPLFGTPIPDAVTTPFALIESVEGKKVTLGIGTAQKVTVGSIYTVFPQGETAFEGSGLGNIKITKVMDTASAAVILDEADIKQGYRAREILHNFGADKLKLLLESSDEDLRSALEEGMAGISFVQFVDSGRHFDQRLILSKFADGLQAALTLDGVPSEPITGADVAGLVDALRPHLENAYAIKFLANLDNPAPPFKVSVWANRAGTETEDLDKAPDEKFVQARLGDVIRFNFRAERDCYLTMINVGTSGKITVLFPNEYRPDGRIEGDIVYRTGTKGEMPFNIRAKGPAGRELVKVIATLEPLNLSSLSLGEEGGLGTRIIESGSSFVQQLARDLEVEGLEDENITLLPTDSWVTDYMIIETSRQ